MAEIRVSYHEQLAELRHDVVRLGALATEAIAAGTEALLDADLAAADRVISADAVLDDLTHSIEQRARASSWPVNSRWPPTFAPS